MVLNRLIPAWRKLTVIAGLHEVKREVSPADVSPPAKSGRLRLVNPLAASLSVLTCVLVPVSAQCLNLGTPGLNGCGTSTPFGIPTLACVGTPTIGNLTFGMTANVPCTFSSGFLLVGACLASPIVIRSGFGPGGFCGPSQAPCAIQVDLATTVAIAGLPRAGGYTFSLPIPNDPRLAGLRVCAQETNLCAITGGGCIAASQGVALTLF
ncbi:MAG: hypothetical protein R3F56_16730 [Planctomycetota bacterium]